MDKTESEIRKLDAAFERSLLCKDLEFLERSLHENFVWIHIIGNLLQAATMGQISLESPQ